MVKLENIWILHKICTRKYTEYIDEKDFFFIIIIIIFYFRLDEVVAIQFNLYTILCTQRNNDTLKYSNI